MPRYLIYARNKKGKTRLAASAPDVLMVDPERGTDYETKINPKSWQVTSWSDVVEVTDYMEAVGHDRHKWVCLDGITRIHGFALNYVRNAAEMASLTRKPDQVSNRDYGKANEMLKALLNRYHAMENVGLVITAQERMETMEADDTEDEDETPGNYLFIPDLPKGSRSAVNGVVDVIGRLYVVKVEATVNGTTKEVQQRRLWLGQSVKYDTGARSEYTLPPFLANPTIPRLTQLVRQGTTKVASQPAERVPTPKPTPTPTPKQEGTE